MRHDFHTAADLSGDAWAEAQYQTAVDVLAEHWNREWEARRQEREAKAAQRIADWLHHAECCEQRALALDAEGLADLAAEQLDRAAMARRQARIEAGGVSRGH